MSSDFFPDVKKINVHGFKSSDIVFIRSRLNGQFVDVKNNSTSNGAELIMYPFNGNENQQFVFKDKRIFSVSSGKCLAISESILYGKTIVIQPVGDPYETSQMFEINEHGQIVSIKYPNMCIDIKGANQAAGTPLILWTCKTISSAADSSSSFNQQFDCIAKSKQQVKSLDLYTTNNKLGGYNCSVSLRPPPSEQNQQKVFFKPLRHEKAILLEIAGSRLSNVITGGLVLLSYRATYKGVAGIYQDFCKMDEKPFRELKVSSNYIVNMDFLKGPHIHQLFVHMIADRLISNWDTHNQVRFAYFSVCYLTSVTNYFISFKNKQTRTLHLMRIINLLALIKKSASTYLNWPVMSCLPFPK